MRGPRPKPTHLKLLQGNPGHRPLNHDEPEPDGDLVAPPERMPARQQLIWRKCIADAPAGLLKHLDTNVLERYCAAKASFDKANYEVDRLGEVVNGLGNQPMHNPYLSIRNNAAKQMRACSDELGFSPAARTRVKVAPKRKAKSALGKLRELRID
jgi:P27 family predicted phage terminase small subunit